MKKYFLLACLFCAGVSFTACDNGEEPGTEIITDAADLDYSADYAASWANYSKQVASLLKNDSQTLYEEWANHFANEFKDGSFSGSQNLSIQQILDGCIDIANEVGTAKIGEPYDYWMSGKTTTAVYAVESWYSWHSRDDYSNNIKSIANSLLGIRLKGNPTTDAVSQANTNSLISYCTSHGISTDVWAKTVEAWNAIQAIPQPFRNNINSNETVQAMAACEELVGSLESLKSNISNLNDEEGLKQVVAQYVDDVVLPTYKELAEKNAALYTAIIALGSSTTNNTFSAACEAWMNARQPWETSEAFLFGPVDQMGLDPNMDSWPLDQDAIVKILTSGNYDALNWTDGDSDDAIEAAQGLRGFHTLEFLLFKNGNPRTVK